MGVSETAKAQVDVKPAPEVDPTEPEEEVPEVPPYFSEDMFPEYVRPSRDAGEKIHDEL